MREDMIMSGIKMTRRDIITLLLLVLMSVFLFADQKIMGAIIKELSKEYSVSRETLGFIGSAFTLIGAIISIIFGFQTDRFSRKKLLVAVVLIGEIPCVLTGIPFFTQSIEAFTVLRILTGIGIGGIYPITFSLLADYFHEEHRATASAWVGVAWVIGQMAGQSIAGFVTPSFGWRLTFILVAIPNFLLVLIFALYAREPERGRTEKALESLIQKGLAYKQKITLSDFKIIFANKTNLWTFLQGLPGTVPWGILGFFMIDFLELKRHFKKEEATLIFMLIGAGLLIGSVLFANIAERLYKKNPKSMPFLCGIGILAGVIPAYILFNIPIETKPLFNDFLIFSIIAFVAGFLVSVPFANVKAILMNVNRPEHRGSVFAVFNITDNIGQGFGPAIGGLLLVFGYQFVMNFSIFWWIPAGILFLVMITSITKDRNNLQELMQNRAKEMSKD